MSALLQLLFLIFSVKILGEAAERIGIPSVMGEILAGASLIVFFHDLETDIIIFFAELGSIFLLFTAGYKDVSLRSLKSESIPALIPTLSQIAFAFAFGFALGRIFEFSILQSLFMGVAFSPTGIGVVLRTLIDLNYLSSRPGTAMLSSAVLDDIIALFLLSVVVTFARFNRIPPAQTILIIAGKILLFLLIMYVSGKYLFPKLFTYAEKMHTKEAVFSLVVVIALLSAYLAERFELHSTIGAFAGGVLVSEIPLAKLPDIQSKVNGLANGILIPLFFAFIGFLIDPYALRNAGSFTLLVILAALSGKLAGGFVGSRAIGFDFYESLIFGLGVMPRAGIELVILTIGRELQIINQEIFSAMVLMVVISILISPACMKWAIQVRQRKAGRQ
ncbi:cation:proton antiporter [Methanosarcina sp. MSH10X1]|uniref:cation:proton antiporter n=1 Tax=Methanosarcina sp. MSH10X1 TaxID=2507075 RepID=UPI000FFB7674|nr:cation:proton antiporter [Methanosarcina sp. MSH10X1]RXA16822.1 cation:proton antiporter [Methanosarcina sp. MSH10X1]